MRSDNFWTRSSSISIQAVIISGIINPVLGLVVFVAVVLINSMGSKPKAATPKPIKTDLMQVAVESQTKAAEIAEFKRNIEAANKRLFSNK